MYTGTRAVHCKIYSRYNKFVILLYIIRMFILVTKCTQNKFINKTKTPVFYIKKCLI